MTDHKNLRYNDAGDSDWEDCTVVGSDATSSDSDGADFFNCKNFRQALTTTGDYNPTRAPKKVVQSLTDIDAAVAEFRDLYLSLSSLGRADLRKIQH